MASNLPSTEVSTLQAEVADARERLAHHLEKLTAPETFAAAKADMMEQVQGYKQQIIGGARDSGEGFVDGMKRRAMANPIPVVMIGAGIAWRFYRHPPIATLLVGAGVAMLMRGKTPADPNAYRNPYKEPYPGPYVPGGVAGYGYPVEASAPGTGAMARVGAAVSEAGDLARDAGTRARDMAAHAGEAVSDMASRAAGAASDAADRARATAADLADRATSAAADAAGWAQETASDVSDRAGSMMSDARDRAGSMVSGMTGSGPSGGTGSSAPQQARWTPPQTQSSSTFANMSGGMRQGAASIADMAQRNTVALGVIGIVAGAILGRSLRSSRAADRIASQAGDTWARGTRRVGSRMRDASDYARDTAERMRDEGSDAAGETWDAASDAASSVSQTVSAAASGAARRAADLASGVGDAASRVTETAGDALSSVTSGVSRATSSAYRTASRQAAYARRRAGAATEGLPGEIANLAQSYPILFGTVGLALGAALGGSLRLSEGEKRVMGPASEMLKERAREIAEQELGQVTQMAERLGDTLQARAAAFGDTDGVPVGDSDPAVVVGGRPRAPGGSIEPATPPSNPGAA
jgi:hypothetical protein